ncbi:MAG: 1-deoxy-D-xylulose-5-phosphate synthase [Parcubacteria group bacterium CG10_big_fil_rev_8_21_14_0_10_38_31]|nr:MAG: 1-deoxy-D-xylulose-5-phosphate synthase [Parcubacteria group bacterium CG10_big_fil_rev_8_21_14_0_10_38_31]
MKKYTDIRDAIFEELYDIALKDKKVVILSADNGASIFKRFEENMPSQFFNVGIAEQNAMSVAAGLAFTGRHVFVVGIANFVTLRCFEQIKIDIASMEMPVTILASGTGYFYGEDGPTHHMTNNLAIMRTIPGLTLWSPSSFSMASHMIHQAYEKQGPSCIWFDRGPFSPLCEEIEGDFSEGAHLVRQGKDVLIISTGIMVGEALKVAEDLEKDGVDAGVLDIYRVKPLNKKILLEIFEKTEKIVTIEEHSLTGGLGSTICEFLSESGLLKPIKMFGIPDSVRYEIGNREYLRSLDGIDASHIVEEIKNWLKM